MPRLSILNKKGTHTIDKNMNKSKKRNKIKIEN